MDKSLFLTLYNQGFTDTEISEKLNSNNTSVGVLRNSLNLKPNLKSHKYLKEIEKFSNLGLTNMEISKYIPLSNTTVRTLRKEFNLQLSPHVKSKFNNDIERLKGKILVRSKARAKQLGLDFNIEQCDLIFPEYCPILNIKLEYSIKIPNNIYAASLDRIDNSKGYIKGNIMIISVLANTMKSNASIEQLKLFCTNMDNLIKNF